MITVIIIGLAVVSLATITISYLGVYIASKVEID